MRLRLADVPNASSKIAQKAHNETGDGAVRDAARDGEAFFQKKLRLIVFAFHLTLKPKPEQRFGDTVANAELTIEAQALLEIGGGGGHLAPIARENASAQQR